MSGERAVLAHKHLCLGKEVRHNTLGALPLADG